MSPIANLAHAGTGSDDAKETVHVGTSGEVEAVSVARGPTMTWFNVGRCRRRGHWPGRIGLLLLGYSAETTKPAAIDEARPEPGPCKKDHRFSNPAFREGSPRAAGDRPACRAFSARSPTLRRRHLPQPTCRMPTG